ncbi:MAG: hypothetical protein ACD_78C00417G0009 [uncultured bacterium (gcode 4)]|uniref:Cohesin domain-containing protein n=1 Tax=uncultured bacterium (gcode 4) TaxID=1234023 RepID=K1XWU4_9BACT|nr:MAG: hypothetical protein ACD_78C00417G0009 [uncultured bacterium (gcode 4)]
MKDIFNDYKKERSRKNVAIITASFVFALSINVFLFGTDSGSRLQTSVLNSTTGVGAEKKVDIELVNAGTGTDMLKIETNSRLENVSRMYISLAFDADSLAINDIFPADKDVDVVRNSNVPGNSIVTLSFKKPTTLKEGAEIFTIVYKKKNSNKTVMNLAETQFKSEDGSIYDLSNSSIEF